MRSSTAACCSISFGRSAIARSISSLAVGTDSVGVFDLVIDSLHLRFNYAAARVELRCATVARPRTGPAGPPGQARQRRERPRPRHCAPCDPRGCCGHQTSITRLPSSEISGPLPGPHDHDGVGQLDQQRSFELLGEASLAQPQHGRVGELAVLVPVDPARRSTAVRRPPAGRRARAARSGRGRGRRAP